MKHLPVGVEFFHPDRQTERHDKAVRFVSLCGTACPKESFKLKNFYSRTAFKATDNKKSFDCDTSSRFETTSCLPWHKMQPDSSVTIANGLRAGKPKNSSVPPLQQEEYSLPAGVKWPSCKAGHSRPCNGKVRNEWSCVFTPQYAFKACTGTVYLSTFTLT
jgi:hypothetical protein